MDCSSHADILESWVDVLDFTSSSCLNYIASFLRQNTGQAQKRPSIRWPILCQLGLDAVPSYVVMEVVAAFQLNFVMAKAAAKYYD